MRALARLGRRLPVRGGVAAATRLSASRRRTGADGSAIARRHAGAPQRGQTTPRSRRIRGINRLTDQRPREVLRVERAEVVELLADADELDRQAELVRDRDRNAALCAAVELRQDDAGDARRFLEQPGLLQAVLARRRVDDEQRLVGRAVE